MPFCTAIFRLLLLLLAMLPGIAFAQTTAPALVPVPADAWRISILSFGPGPEIFERYGHSAIRLRNDRAKIDVCYDWGNFSFDDPNFIGRFVKGDLRYWMEGKDTLAMLHVYIDLWDRTVVEQELNLDLAQNLRLRQIIAAQDDEADRYYAYDYFKDNCATRVRDTIDKATDGALRAHAKELTDHSYRWQNRRVVPVGALNQALLPLMDMVMGPRIDPPLSRWDACFLPGVLAGELDATRVQSPVGEVPLVKERRVLNTTKTPANIEPADATNPVWWTLPIGLLGGIGLALVSRRSPIAFKLGATLWEAFACFGSVFMIGIVCFTRHWVVAWNANLLQFTPLALLLLLAIWSGRLRDRLGCAAIGAVGLSVIGLLVTISRLTPQSNVAGIALALPLHVGVLVGLRQLAQRRLVAAGEAGNAFAVEASTQGLAT